MVGRLVAAGLVLALVAGCGGSSGPNPAKLRFAVAQAVEALMASDQGLTQNGNELTTICSTKTGTSLFCSSFYTPASGVVTLTNQDVADENATYVHNGSVQLTPASDVAGQGLNQRIPAVSIRKLINEDGNNVGAITQSGPIQLTSGELAKQSESTLLTVAALLTPAQRAASESGSASVPSSPPPTTTTTNSAGGAPVSGGSSASGFGSPCGTVTGGTDDFPNYTLTVHPGSGVSCGTAMQVLTDLSAGSAQDHRGSSQTSSYYIVDGWTCPYGNQGVQLCTQGQRYIEATAPGFQTFQP